VSAVADSSPASPVLLDTHVLVWLVEGNTKLRPVARSMIQKAADEGRATISAITPWEIALLVSKGRLQLGADVMQWIHAVLSKPGLQLVPLDPEIAVASTRLPFEMHADPADRILVATARHLGATFVTADGALLEFSKQGHFVAMDAAA